MEEKRGVMAYWEGVLNGEPHRNCTNTMQLFGESETLGGTLHQTFQMNGLMANILAQN